MLTLKHKGINVEIIHIAILFAIVMFFLTFWISLPLATSQGEAPRTSTIRALDWSPSGEYIALARQNGTIEVVSPNDPQVLYNLTPPSAEFAFSIAWSPNGLYLAAGVDNQIYVWDTTTWNEQYILTSHIDRVNSIAWSYDSTKLASIDQFGRPNVRLWNMTTNPPSLITAFRAGVAYDVKWHPSDNTKFALGQEARAEVYSDTGQPINEIRHPDYGVELAWNPADSNLIATATSEGQVFILSTTSWEVLYTLNGHSDWVFGLEWKPDGAQLTSVSRDGTIKFWSVDGELVDNISTTAGVYAVAWSPDGNWLAYGGEGDNETLQIIPAPTSVVCDHDIPAADTATLISTITTANGPGTPTTICLAQDSTYTFTTANNYLNALPYITGDITIEGHNATITRSGTEAFRFFEVKTGGKLTLNGITLSNGDVTGETERGGALMNDGGQTILNNVTFNGNAGNTGGAIDNEAGTLTITDSTFTNNAGAYGGAIDNDSPATLTIAGSTFTSNTAVYDGGVIDNDGVLTISSSTFTSNTAAEYGGVIDNDGTLTINASMFTSNSSEGGGAIRNASTLTINAGSAFSTNAATNLGWGGAIYNKSDSTVIINSTSFSGNTANLEGGAIRNQGNLTVNTGSSFDGNAAAQYGGAIYNTGGTVSLTGVQITNNSTTTYDAGAIYGNSSSSLTLTDSTLSGNTSGRRGGGIWSSGTATLTNVTITNNTAVVEGGGVYGSSSATISAGNSCITGNSSRAVYSASATNQNFENNWWGATDGPSGSGSGAGDAVNSKIDYDPFITTSCPLP